MPFLWLFWILMGQRAELAQWWADVLEGKIKIGQ